MDNLVNLIDLTTDELTEYVISLGFKKFRAAQIRHWLLRGAVDFADMTDISIADRELLNANCRTGLPRIAEKHISALDGTVKYLLGLWDGNVIESVVMRYRHGISICISSQVGCRMGCAFCASTIGGLTRNLSSGEMLGQIICAQADIGERISSVVLMGIGEPLDNYDNVVRFLHEVTSPDSLDIGSRHISLSTSGLADRIIRLAQEDLQITLSISLHCADDAGRSELMPVNRRWNIEELLTSCRKYFEITGRRISFEYTLISGKNDSMDDAGKLADCLMRYLRGIPFHVNLIPVNPVEGKAFAAGERDSIERFRNALEKRRINATIRRRLGSDINASCGQLRKKHIESVIPPDIQQELSEN